MSDLEQRLADAFRDQGDQAPHDPDLLGTVLRDRPRRWPSPRITVAAAAAVAVVAVAVPVLSLGGDSEPEPAGYTCPATLAPDTLPEWARDGFSDPAVAPYVIGANSSIVGVVFGDPLLFPPASGKQNKVLWVPREGGGELTVSGRLVPDSPPVVIESNTGPSVLDLPAPGCWHLDLTWPGGSDSLALRVADGRQAVGDQGPCSAGSGDGAQSGLAWREPVDWAGVVDHLVEVTAGERPAGVVRRPFELADLPVDVDRVLWSRPGASALPRDLSLVVAACAVGPVSRTTGEPNWVPGQRYVATVLHLPAHDGSPEGWAPLSPGSVFAYDDGTLEVHRGLYLDSTWQQRLVGQPASALVDVLRATERDNADLLAPLADEPDPYVRSSILLGRG